MNWIDKWLVNDFIFVNVIKEKQQKSFYVDIPRELIVYQGILVVVMFILDIQLLNMKNLDWSNFIISGIFGSILGTASYFLVITRAKKYILENTLTIHKLNITKRVIMALFIALVYFALISLLFKLIGDFSKYYGLNSAVFFALFYLFEMNLWLILFIRKNRGIMFQYETDNKQPD